jgi:hypothetical protein
MEKTQEEEIAEGLNKIARYGLAVGLANPAADCGPEKVKRFDGIFKQALAVRETRLQKIAAAVLESFGTKPATA